MPSVNNIKLTIGGPESTPGDPVARTHVIPVRGLPGLDKAAERAEDPAITGENMAVGEYFMADSVGGGIPLAVRPCAGIGKLLKSCLGTEATPVQVAACIRIRYKGTEASCKLVANTTADTLASSIGDKGSEIADNNFGTSGSIDLTALDTDTVGELVTEIDGYTDYECEKLFGEDSVDAGEIIDITAVQAKGMWAYVWFSSADSGIYAHIFTVDLGNDERDTYSIQKDGFQDNFLYAGCVVNTFSLSAALKAMVEAECDNLGFTEAGSQSASSLTLEDVNPLVFQQGSFSLGTKEYTYIRNHSLAFNNNHNAEGYGQGSSSRQYHQKGKFEASGDCQLRLDADSYAERAKAFDGSLIALSFYYKGKVVTANIPELMLIELPYCTINEPAWPENAGVIDIKLGFRVLKPKGTIYNEPVKITLLTKDSAAY